MKKTEEQKSVDNGLDGEHIIYAANDWRTDNRTSSHHIAARLSLNNRILYLEAAGQRKPRASTRDARRIVSRIWKAFREPVKVQHNVYVISPFIVPLHRYRWIRSLNSWLLRTCVRKACKILKFERPVIWLSIPHYSAVIDAVPAKGVVYYCTDDFSSFPKTNRESIMDMEQDILSRANVVFTVSRPLLKDKARYNANIVLSSHGVDVTHFGKALADETVVPGEIAEIRRPIAGFFGIIEEWFDLELLDYCAARLDDFSFVLIGRSTLDLKPVTARGNVYFLGPKPYERIPNYLKAFDVGLIPFKLNDTILYSNPLKFKEYLAGGRPVVSVRVDAFRGFENLAYLVDSYEEFAQAISASLRENSPDKVMARVSAMARESWDHKFQHISQHARAHIPK